MSANNIQAGGATVTITAVNQTGQGVAQAQGAIGGMAGRISESLKSINPYAIAAAAGIAALTIAAKGVIETFQAGADSIRSAAEEAEKLGMSVEAWSGGLVTQEEVETIQALDDAILSLTLQGEDLAQMFATGLAPEIETAAYFAAAVAQELPAVINGYLEWAKAILKVADVFGILTPMMEGFLKDVENIAAVQKADFAVTLKARSDAAEARKVAAQKLQDEAKALADAMADAKRLADFEAKLTEEALAYENQERLKMIEKEADASRKAKADLAREAQSIIEANMTPEERADRDRQRVEALAQGGQLDDTQVQRALKRIQDGLAEATAISERIRVGGTFNGTMASLALGVSTVAERTAKATERTAKATEKIAERDAGTVVT